MFLQDKMFNRDIYKLAVINRLSVSFLCSRLVRPRRVKMEVLVCRATGTTSLNAIAKTATPENTVRKVY